MKRLGFVLACVCLVLTALPVAAQGRPFREPAEGGPAEFAAGEVCPFPVLVDTVHNNEIATTFTDKDGNPTHQIITGRLVLRITNLATDASIVRNVSGPVMRTFNADGTLTILLRGGSLLYLFASDAGGPGLWLSSGPVRLEIDAANNVTSTVRPAHSQDVCAMLA